MTCYDVCLEIGAAGECMAHVLDLPGCFARANSQEEALAALPAAICAHYAWLRVHGEPISNLQEPISLHVAETSTGFVPFWRGSQAALFAPDRMPVSRDEMEVYFRRAGYSRIDLLVLVRNLSDEILDWKADQDSMSIREILRHVGNAEEWYVSRLVDPTTLPREWEHDEDLPVFEFLEMERHTVLDRLRRLTDEKIAELNLVVRPDLILLDERRTFITRGPAHGELREPNLILASRDRVAADVEGLKIIGRYAGHELPADVWELPQLRHAVELGLGAREYRVVEG